jgi:RNA polymerase sigma-70 factor (ECF subfamily)
MNKLPMDNAEQIVQLITRYQRRLFVYIRSLLPLRAEADEVLQEVNLYLWRHADEFRPGTDFAAWAYKVAYFHVLSFRKKHARERLRFSDALLEQLADRATATAEQSDARQEALEGCLRKLPQGDRELLRLRYEAGESTQSIAQSVGRSLQAVYRALNRIHLSLLDCVRQSIRLETR